MSDYNTFLSSYPFTHLEFEMLGYSFIAVFSYQYGICGLLSNINTGAFEADLARILEPNFQEAYYRAKRVAYNYICGHMLNLMALALQKRDPSGKPEFKIDSEEKWLRQTLWWCDYILTQKVSETIHQPSTLENIAYVKNTCEVAIQVVNTPLANGIKKQTDKTGYVYLLKSENGFYKIGCTKYPDDRLHTFEVKLPFRVEYEHLIYALDRRKLERELHTRYAAKRLDGEFFKLSDEEVEQIKAIRDEVEPPIDDFLSLPLFSHLRRVD